MNRKSAIIFLASLIIIGCFLYVLYFAYRIQKISKGNNVDKRPYEYHILVSGIMQNPEFMAEFFKGAKFAASAFNGITEYLEANNCENNLTVENIFDYARYSDTDGLIVFSDDETFFAQRIENVHGKEIPVVVVGECKPESYQVSNVISSKYKISKMVAHEIRNGKWKKPIAFVRQSMAYNNTFRIISGIDKELPELENIKVCQFNLRDSADDEIRAALISLSQDDSADVIICFSAEEANLTAQTIIDQNLTDKFSVIGIFGDNKTKEFLKKGIVSSIIYVDSWEAGAVAASELFSWKKDGFANQYRQLNPKLITGGTE